MKKLLVACTTLLVLVGARAQSPRPAFEVASVKPSDPSSGGRKILLSRANNSLTIQGLSPKELIGFAYGPEGGGSVPSDLIVGGPKWLDDGRYDVAAKAAGSASQEERRQMLRTLLVERFHLAFHYEARETSAYVLSAGKSSAKLKARKPDDGGEPFTIRDTGNMHFICRDISMARLSTFLEQVLSRRVSDNTGLTGTFDFDLAWRPDESQFGGRFATAPEKESDLPDLFTALRDLGLKMESGKAPVQFLVVDHAEKPSEN